MLSAFSSFSIYDSGIQGIYIVSGSFNPQQKCRYYNDCRRFICLYKHLNHQIYEQDKKDLSKYIAINREQFPEENKLYYLYKSTRKCGDFLDKRFYYKRPIDLNAEENFTSIKTDEAALSTFSLLDEERSSAHPCNSQSDTLAVNSEKLFSACSIDQGDGKGFEKEVYDDKKHAGSSDAKAISPRNDTVDDSFVVYDIPIVPPMPKKPEKVEWGLDNCHVLELIEDLLED